MTNTLTLVENTSTTLDAITPQILRYVDRYQTFLKKTAESVIGLATTIVEAEAGLNALDYAVFLHQIGLADDPATVSKLKKIGNNAARFQPYIHKMPSAWTTIYKLASLDRDDFDRVAVDISPFITAREINNLTSGTSSEKVSSNTDIAIDMTGLDTGKKLDFYNALESLNTNFGVKVNEKKALRDELAKYRVSAAA